MVAPLGPGKFYGRSLPRPRYTKFDIDRVDPPVPVLDALLSWANEAHWSNGGLSFDRLRHQGRIEGNIQKLREENEKIVKNQRKKAASLNDLKGLESDEVMKAAVKREESVSPPDAPNAPIAKKRRRFMSLIDDNEENPNEEIVEKNDAAVRVRRSTVRKLDVEFEKVASKSGSPNFDEHGDYDENVGKIRASLLRSKMMKAAENMTNKSSNNVASRTRDKTWQNIGEKSLSPPASVDRTSPRLMKNRQGNMI